MSDLISRQAAIDAVIKETYMDGAYGYSDAKSLVDAICDLPSAQPEIVRCKDCKYVGTDATCCLVCNREGMGLKPYHVRKDDYCSYAERRTDD